MKNIVYDIILLVIGIMMGVLIGGYLGQYLGVDMYVLHNCMNYPFLLLDSSRYLACLRP